LLERDGLYARLYHTQFRDEGERLNALGEASALPAAAD
jgi:hypothetical protein